MSESFLLLAWLCCFGVAAYVARTFWVLYTDTHLDVHPGWTFEWPPLHRHDSCDELDPHRHRIPRLKLVVYLMAHSHQAGQRWIFMIRVSCLDRRAQRDGRRPYWKHCRFGYRTYGDCNPEYLSYFDGGWYWPWQTNRWPCGLA